jgi:murein endopeptidase
MPTDNPAFVVRDPERAYGTDETVRWLLAAFEHVRSESPEIPRVEVHDISVREGGRLNGHHSHESGRDADVAYYQTDCGPLCVFRGPLAARELDVVHQWALFAYWLERGQADAIFVDHTLQQPLFERARTLGASRADLSRWFQYPRAVGERVGVIRHHPRHADHFHVRFVCDRSDPQCES